MIRLGFVATGILLLSACFQSLPAQEAEHVGVPSSASSGVLHTLKIAGKNLSVELACSSAEQQKGLMHRSHLPDNQGMLFVFKRESILAFWMKNTLIPLSIAYINAQGQIVDIQDMLPLDERSHPAAKPAQFALEVNQGWFKSQGITVGERIQLDSFCSHR